MYRHSQKTTLTKHTKLLPEKSAEYANAGKESFFKEQRW
jgi:hypothetical protein